MRMRLSILAGCVALGLTLTAPGPATGAPKGPYTDLARTDPPRRGPFPRPRPLSSGGQGPVNARILRDAGMAYAYCTDTQLGDIFNLTRVVLVMKDKRVVSDKRGKWPPAG
jgi:hypothetical protein